jgi:hypothetical protein
MPPPVAALAGISAGSNILGQGLNLWQNERQNRKSREFSREMYGRQYQDEISFWNMQNAYNDPKEQMRRLREAGLNPALMYGGAGSGAAGQASSMHSPGAMAAKHETTDFSQLGGIVNQYQQAGLMAKQGAVMDSQVLMNIEKAALIGSQKDRSKFDLRIDSELEDVSKQIKRETLDNLRTRNKFLLTEEERRVAMHAKNLEKATEQIAQSRYRTKNILPKEARRIDNQIADIYQSKEMKRYENNMRKKGLSFRDPRMWRVLSTVVDAVFEGKTNKEILRMIDLFLSKNFSN